MKKIKIILLILLFISINTFAQSLKDFYIPSQLNYNKASFYSPNKLGERTDKIRVIYYIDNNDKTYNIMDAYMSQGQATSIITQTIIITPTEVKMTKSVSTNLLGTNKKRNYQPARTLLKTPSSGKSTFWTIPGENGDLPTNYTSSWATITIDGINKKAIKVVSQYTGWKSKTVLYYVLGIGLMKTDFIGEDGIIKPYEKFDGLSFEETSK